MEPSPSQETPPPHATLGLATSPTLHLLRPDRERLPLLRAKPLGRYVPVLPASDDDDEDINGSGDDSKSEWQDGEWNPEEGEIIDDAASDNDHASSPSVATSTASTKNSRYLREIDRQAILVRLENGEKQAELAREFNVSRAAICNLNKHRDDVMARAQAGNPYAKHPKKPRALSTTSTRKKVRTRNRHRGVSPPTVATAAEATSPAPKTKSCPLSVSHLDPVPSSEQCVASNQSHPSRLHSIQQLCSRSVAMLLTKVHDRNTAPQEFQRVTSRLIHALVEETLSRVPIKHVQVQVSDHEWLNGLQGATPTCAISMERTLCPVLDTFHLLEPQCPSGYLRVIRATNNNRVPVMVHILDAHLPSNLLQHTVLLLDLVSSSSELVCAAIQKLLDHGVMECQITLVTVFALSDVVAAVNLQFPSVCMLTTEIVKARSSGDNDEKML
uniref:Phosphoribosyltransferase domain-containing protein n=1 Tax=Globisporangium ultimum (strain ATCC 200006 / CBS 805.95 / DAOM BR144) TaxID=431595 RepID=K3WQR3_GLOUD